MEKREETHEEVLLETCEAHSVTRSGIPSF